MWEKVEEQLASLFLWSPQVKDISDPFQDVIFNGLYKRLALGENETERPYYAECNLGIRHVLLSDHAFIPEGELMWTHRDKREHGQWVIHVLHGRRGNLWGHVSIKTYIKSLRHNNCLFFSTLRHLRQTESTPWLCWQLRAIHKYVSVSGCFFTVLFIICSAPIVLKFDAWQRLGCLLCNFLPPSYSFKSINKNHYSSQNEHLVKLMMTK